MPVVRNGLAGWNAWIGGATFVAIGNIVGRTFVRLDQLRGENEALVASLATANGQLGLLQSLRGLRPWIIGDSMARPDNVAIGTADKGQAWTNVVGAFKIAAKAATPSAVADTTAVQETGVVDHWVTVTFDYVLTTAPRMVIARYVDASNFYRFGVVSGAVKLQKIVAGAAKVIGPDLPAVANGATLGLRCVGSTIEMYINGILVGTQVDSALAGTKAGIQDSSGDGRYSMFRVRTS